MAVTRYRSPTHDHKLMTRTLTVLAKRMVPQEQHFHVGSLARTENNALQGRKIAM